MSAGERPKWQPFGGNERVMPLDETTLDVGRPVRTEDSGARNGMPEWRPYVRNPAIRAREDAVEARLAAVRAEIQRRIDEGE
jgi:hypothetical protein